MERGRILRWRPTVTNNFNDIATMDLHEAPIYTASDVAFYTGAHLSTLRYWLEGTKSNPAPIRASGKTFERARFSFANLLEAHVLLATRDADIPLARIRRATHWLQNQYPNAAHPLLVHARDFHYAENRRDLFIMTMETPDPINASLYGQTVFGDIFNRYLRRIEWDETGPVRLFPIRSNRIEINVSVASGQPVVRDTGILARMLFGRYRAGESYADLATDYRLNLSDVKEAVRYFETAA